MILPRALLLTLAIGAASSALADDMACSAASITQATQAQSAQIDAYLAARADTQRAQTELQGVAQQLQQSGQVSAHQDEFEKLARGESFEPTQAFCDDMRTTMDALTVYMQQNPAG
ncbi:hypothetical protein [Salinicola halophilus]|uniref:hypothetical protein n=1 Tax=Salinicola halophilus TaxID=184065 RepID=UPI000DA1EBE4|nr:hypothetical protein [Salinicola halophilus]